MKQAEVYRRLRDHCLGFEGAVEEYPWGHTAWKVKKKCFAIGDETTCFVTVKSTLDKQAALVQLPFIEVASHVGRFGWVTLEVTDQESLEMALELIRESYDSIAAKGKERSKPKAAPGP